MVATLAGDIVMNPDRFKSSRSKFVKRNTRSRCKGSAKADAILCLGEGTLDSLSRGGINRSKHVRRIKPMIAKESVERSMPLVRSGLRQDVDHAAVRTPEFRDTTGSDDLEFANDFLAEERTGKIRRIVIGGKAIDHEIRSPDFAVPPPRFPFPEPRMFRRSVRCFPYSFSTLREREERDPDSSGRSRAALRSRR